jgi:predicted ribosome quality control (RQC) complex YloA/Tae2 family protein
MKIIEKEDTIFWVGRNARDNWDAISQSDSNWLWFHLDKFPSSHVIICKEKNNISKKDIENACNLLLNYSKYKFNNIGIVYCEINNLLFGIETGSVIFKSNNKVEKIKYIL